MKLSTVLAVAAGFFVADVALPAGFRTLENLTGGWLATSAMAGVEQENPVPVVSAPDGTAARMARFVAPAMRMAELDTVVAQAPAPAAQAAPAAAATTATTTAPVVDETALRYFAREGDARRLETEIARLKALYPNWTPPANPLEIPDAGDVQLDALWKLYSEERYAEVRAAIAARQAAEPGWQMPPDLLERLAVAEARLRLINASNLQQYDTVVRVAAETPSLLTCSEVDVLWRLARAFSETKRPERALDAYRYILTSCDNSGERLATMQMAVQRLTRPAVGTLLALERTGPDGIGEFASVRSDVARQAVTSAADDATSVTDPSDLAALEKLASEGGLAADQMLLGWYFLKRNDPKMAEGWFRKAIAHAPSAEASQGLALALLALKQPAEAETLMRPFASSSDDARSVYLAAGTNLLAVQPQVMLAPTVIAEIVNQAAAAKAPDAAQLLGWYSYNLNQFVTAGQWFATALAWKPDEEMSAFGLALTRQRLGNAAGLRQLQAAWEGRSPRIAMVGREAAPGTVVAEQQAMVLQRNGQMQAMGQPASQPAPSTIQPQPAPQMNTDQPAGQSAPVQPLSQPAQGTPARQPSPSAGAREPREERYGQPSPRVASARSGGSSTVGCRIPVSPTTLSAQTALDRGWCLMGLNRPLEAAPAFEVALQGGTAAIQKEATYGQSLAYLRVGLNNKAAVSAARSPQPRARRIEISTALLSAQATTAFEAKRPVETLMALDQLAQLAPERLDLMVLRGYAYMELRRYGDAQRVFSAAAAAGSSAGLKGLNDLRLATGQFKSDG